MQLTKRFYNHKGLDLKSSDLIRPAEYASGMLNAEYSDGGAIKKRVGYQGHASSCGYSGMWTYQRVDPDTGIGAPEVLCVDENLFGLVDAQISVTYAGANPTCEISIFLDSTTSLYRAQILEGTTLVLDYSLGKGFDETTPITLADLKTQIDAIANFSATITGSTTVPAAFIKTVRNFDLTAGAYTGIADYWVQIYSPTTDPFAAHFATRNDDDFENVSSIQINNVIYFSNGIDEVYKYDGQNFYRAGLPTPASFSVGLSAGAVTGSNYIHKIQYFQIDASGNFIEGNITSSTAQNAAAQQFDITVPNILAASGFNTNCAVVNGLQSGVTTITVDNGSGGAHTLQVGDTAYFYDGVSTAYVTRTVTARTNTSITISGAAVNVADNAVISNNLRILIWRSKSSATTPTAFYLVDEIPNNSFAATQSYTDNNIDSALGELLFPPATDRSPPPKGKYISQWNGQMCIAGSFESPTSFYYSDIDGPEYFPADSNQLFIEPGNGDIITGIAPNNEVFTIHGAVSFTVISGDISTGQIRVETRARDVGCVAHATIQDMDGVLGWLSPQGPRMSSGGQVPVPMGPAIDPSESNQASRIDPDFNNEGRSETEKYQFKRAVGFNYTSADKYLLFVPCESVEGGERYTNSNSRVYAYDRVRDAWLKWSNLDFSAGVCVFGDEFYFIERRYSEFESAVQHILYRRHNLSDAFDYADNVDPIDFDYSPQWEALGEPSVLKDCLAIRVFSVESVPNNQFDLTIEQENNFQADANVATFVVEISGGGYGNSAYGDDPYSDPTVDAFLHPMARSRLRATRPRFKNEVIHEAVLITGWELEFSTPYRPEFKS